MERRAFVVRTWPALLAALSVLGRRLWAGSPYRRSLLRPSLFRRAVRVAAAPSGWSISRQRLRTRACRRGRNGQLKDKMGVPSRVRSCHTARLAGISSKGMSQPRTFAGSWRNGRKLPDWRCRRCLRIRLAWHPQEPSHGNFDVLAFQFDGTTRTFASH